MKKQLISLTLAAVMMFSLTACDNSEQENDPDITDSADPDVTDVLAAEPEIPTHLAGDYSEVFKMVKLANDRRFEENGALTTESMMDEDMEMEGAMGVAAEVNSVSEERAVADDSSKLLPMGGDEGAQSTEYSDTNNQVAGVQESDIVKTDGKYIFVANNNYDFENGGGSSGKVSVVKPENGNMEIATQIVLEAAYPSEMLLYGQKLIIIWTKSQYVDSPTARAGAIVKNSWGGSMHIQETTVQVYDISPEQPDFSQPAYTYTQDGGFSFARMVENNIYLLTNYTPDIPETFEEGDLDCYVPSLTQNGERSYVPADCIVLPERLEYVFYTIIGGLDVNNPEMSVSVCSNLGSAGLIYATLQNIYLTRTDYESPNGEENTNIRYGSWYWNSEPYTVIDKFAIDAGRVNFTANGKIKGDALNQFNFDEYNGVFRAVTQVHGIDPDVDPAEYPPMPQEPERPDFSGENWETANQWYTDVYEKWYDENAEQIMAYEKWWGKNYGNQGASLYTLDGNLNELAAIHGIAKGERVQSVRFMGDTGYVVTFLQRDPLFSFDLSDPYNPVKTDELKIPGYSTYMHPWADGLLLGMGVDSVDDENSPQFGNRNGLKLSMFDVSDGQELSERHVYNIANSSEESWSNSPVEYEHKAALVAPEKNIIGFPYSYSYNETGGDSWAYTRKTVYAVFSYGDEGFTLLGQIEFTLDDYDWWDFNRGLYIDDYLYAIANDLIVSAKIEPDALGETQELRL